MLALNLSAPSRERVRGLLEYLGGRDEELLVLSEVSGGQGSSLLLQVCRASGYTVLGPGTLPARERGVVVVAREGLVAQPDEEAADLTLLPHRRQAVGAGGWRVWGLYGPASDPVRYSSSAQRARKREWLAALDESLLSARDAGTAPHLLVGDLNVVPPGHDPALKYVLAEERDWFTRATSPAPDGLGYVDALGLSARTATPDETTWVDHTGAGVRYDHALLDAVAAPRVVSCGIDQSPREDGLTDHAALWVHLAGSA